jgi:hypothetical protein
MNNVKKYPRSYNGAGMHEESEATSKQPSKKPLITINRINLPSGSQFSFIAPTPFFSCP